MCRKRAGGGGQRRQRLRVHCLRDLPLEAAHSTDPCTDCCTAADTPQLQRRSGLGWPSATPPSSRPLLLSMATLTLSPAHGAVLAVTASSVIIHSEQTQGWRRRCRPPAAAAAARRRESVELHSLALALSCCRRLHEPEDWAGPPEVRRPLPGPVRASGWVQRSSGRAWRRLGAAAPLPLTLRGRWHCSAATSSLPTRSRCLQTTSTPTSSTGELFKQH